MSQRALINPYNRRAASVAMNQWAYNAALVGRNYNALRYGVAINPYAPYGMNPSATLFWTYRTALTNPYLYPVAPYYGGVPVVYSAVVVTPPYGGYGGYGGVYGAPLISVMVPTQEALLPHPSGPITVPPADAAVIRLSIPNEFGQVWFDGVMTTSIGTTRYYVTPTLPGDQSFRYVIRATFQSGGETVSEEREIRVRPGQTTAVDFTQP
jgi:uncharacterized protein (TIGR03000 family)